MNRRILLIANPAAAVGRMARRWESLLVDLETRKLKCTTPAVKRLFGPRYCYSVGFFRALLGFRSPTMRVRCDEREFNGRMFLVSAGNAEIVGAGTMRLSPGAKVDDGKLNVNVIEDLGRLETARWFPKVLKGMHTTHPKVHYFAATSVTVECEPQLEVQLDGELFGHTPATFRVMPRAIRVICVHRAARAGS